MWLAFSFRVHHELFYVLKKIGSILFFTLSDVWQVYGLEDWKSGLTYVQ